jgi:hypothetical protein
MRDSKSTGATALSRGFRQKIIRGRILSSFQIQNLFSLFVRKSKHLLLFEYFKNSSA